MRNGKAALVNGIAIKIQQDGAKPLTGHGNVIIRVVNIPRMVP